MSGVVSDPDAPLVPPPLRLENWWLPHRVALIGLGSGLVILMAVRMRWDWVPAHLPSLGWGLVVTLLMLVSSVLIGFVFAVPLGLAQAAGPAILAWPARIFCTAIRGTPLLLQMWLLYYGVGSLFPYIPGIRQTWIWPLLREAWPYGVLALSLSFAGYEGEVMRGAFAGVPKRELVAADAFGMGPWTRLRRIWLPRAFRRALPTLTGEVVLQLKSTPLVATITVLDLYAAITRVRQETFLTYEPLLLLAALYFLLTTILVTFARRFEARSPGH